MRVIGITGLPGAGKSIAAEVAKEAGVPVERMGDAVWEEVRRRGLPVTDENVSSVSDAMRKERHAAIWAERTSERLAASPAPVVVIDGIRSMAEVEYFRATLGTDFTLVAITAPDDQRMKRVLARRRADEAQDRDRFEARDRRELQWGLADVVAGAEVTLENAGDISSIKRRFKAILEGRR
ncbi:MAG: AAA family ATPase [Euryarchaeota archaeon]|nr:AAA family ATPase [Euryarchaeota archaeon]